MRRPWDFRTLASAATPVLNPDAALGGPAFLAIGRRRADHAAFEQLGEVIDRLESQSVGNLAYRQGRVGEQLGRPMDAVVQLELTRREACVLFEDSAKPRVADIQLRRLQPSFERRRLHDNELFHLPSLLAQFEEEFNTQKQLR